ncbi:MAG: glucuronate isomerase [Clostridiales bacterium]|nr:glucuronate isomerase [Clostridiales bacterium]
MKPFMDEDFLLDTPAAKTLYHDYAEDSPICDYHCHLSPKEIYENRPPENIADLWLGGDHYKWRAMRSCGIGEAFCTGNAAGREKFLAYARTLDLCIGNPLYHWSHLELKRYFGINTPLNSRTAPEIWDAANQAIGAGDFRPRSLILRSKVTHLCTTDDPADDLYYHKLLAKKGNFSCKVLPTFRPDRTFQVNQDAYPAYIQSLGESADLVIRTLDDLKEALMRRMDTIHALGCRISEQGLEYIPAIHLPAHQLERVFINALDGHPASPEETDALTLHLLTFLGREYARRGRAIELHVRPLRTTNTRR